MERVWEVFADAWNILLNELFVNDAVPVALADIGTAVARAYDDCGCRHLHVDLMAWAGLIVIACCLLLGTGSRWFTARFYCESDGTVKQNGSRTYLPAYIRNR